ncbi:putative tRNA N6-adenosine threonylcarbamoyltransferase mitochondrial [Taenia crassiceps]|uniref:N(6)-L-threonylcarbamoyladenine synthase n=1 Tax=Taenia crassiceps TaxID=6207 RepID=A0ABR4QK66_9CEST
MWSSLRVNVLASFTFSRFSAGLFGFPNPVASRPLSTILGIETSCDDTGAAVVNSKRMILGESLASQTPTSIKMGGVVPPIAQKLHIENIEETVSGAMKKSGISWGDLDAIAVTVKPGMALSLKIGVVYAKQLAVEHSLASKWWTFATYPR